MPSHVYFFSYLGGDDFKERLTYGPESTAKNPLGGFQVKEPADHLVPKAVSEQDRIFEFSILFITHCSKSMV